MKTLLRIFLVILFIPLFLIQVLTATIKFQLLDHSFWITTFEENNVYPALSDVLKTTTEKEIETSGGDKEGSLVLTELITSDNLKITVEKNITNTLNYFNGKDNVLLIYLPISRAPEGFLPANISSIPDEITLDLLLTEFNFQGLPLKEIRTVPLYVRQFTYLWYFNLFLIAVISVLLVVLVSPGRRFTALGISFLIPGVLILLLTLGLFVIKGSMLTDWVRGSEPSQLILATFLPYILAKIINLWVVIGSAAVTLGIVAFFLKKQSINSITK